MKYRIPCVCDARAVYTPTTEALLGVPRPVPHTHEVEADSREQARAILRARIVAERADDDQTYNPG